MTTFVIVIVLLAAAVVGGGYLVYRFRSTVDQGVAVAKKVEGEVKAVVDDVKKV